MDKLIWIGIVDNSISLEIIGENRGKNAVGMCMVFTPPVHGVHTPCACGAHPIFYDILIDWRKI